MTSFVGENMIDWASWTPADGHSLAPHARCETCYVLCTPVVRNIFFRHPGRPRTHLTLHADTSFDYIMLCLVHISSEQYHCFGILDTRTFT